MQKFTILGNPARHSKSPALFGAAYQRYTGLSYEINEPTSAEECVEILKTRYDGGNITAPFKEDIYRFADELSETARLIEAVNTVTVHNGRLKADNCDHCGVSGSFEEFGVALQGKTCVLLGIGGAGKAAAYAVCKAGGKLTIVNRTVQKATDFASKIGCRAAPVDSLADLLQSADVIINTLYGNIDLIDRKLLNTRQVILDASYIGSPLLDKARSLNCTVIDGRYWLYCQALYCFKLFTGIDPDRAAMRKVLNI
ncbi:MAG: hypothetical protein LBD59_07075 [Prevotellaceae bacterium]|jgi:shikimate dehydrogenase|nr:hypothetical protein [Prevotellaceae bacterium]